MNSHPDVTVNGEDTYRVEVSGWDAKENFFVEKTTLEWKPEDKKSMLLRADIRPGCIVFVRLLQPLAIATSFPIAYEALTNAEKDKTGASRVSLERSAKTNLRTTEDEGYEGAQVTDTRKTFEPSRRVTTLRSYLH